MCGLTCESCEDDKNIDVNSHDTTAEQSVKGLADRLPNTLTNSLLPVRLSTHMQQQLLEFIVYSLILEH